MLINPIMFAVKEGVSVLRTRFGFARTAGTSIRAGTGNYLTQFIVLQTSDFRPTFFLIRASQPGLSQDRATAEIIPQQTGIL